MTVTFAVSLAVTSGPTGGCPVALAVFVNDAVAPARLQLIVVLAAGASSPIVFAQSGAIASATATFVSGTSPVFVTTSVKVAVDPDRIVWDFGVLVMEMPGCETRTDSPASLQAPLTGRLLASPG